MLKNNKPDRGHIYYVAPDTLGILAFVDASETVPTFGASFHEVRAFILDSEKSNNILLFFFSFEVGR
jgi:N-acetylmuramic acid 6-phosphate (MurNAc-6-P) etherase